MDLRIVVVLLALVAAYGCDGHAPVRREVEQAVERTVPGEPKPYVSALNRSPWSAETTWEFQTDWT